MWTKFEVALYQRMLARQSSLAGLYQQHRGERASVRALMGIKFCALSSRGVGWRNLRDWWVVENAYGWSKRIHWGRTKEVLVLHVSISTRANTRDNIKRTTFQNLQTGNLILRFNFGSGRLHLHVRTSYYKSMMSCVPNLGESTIGE